MSDDRPQRPRLELGVLREKREPDGRRWFSIQFGLLRLVAFEVEPFVPDPDVPTLVGEFSCFLQQNEFITQQAAKRRARVRQRRLAAQPIRPSAPRPDEMRDYDRSAKPDRAPPPEADPKEAAYTQLHPSKRMSKRAAQEHAARQVLSDLGVADQELDDGRPIDL